MYEALVAEVDADMRGLSPLQAEEEEIPGLELLDRDRSSKVIESCDGMRQPRSAGSPEAIDDEPAAVETRGGCRAAVAIGFAHHRSCMARSGLAEWSAFGRFYDRYCDRDFDRDRDDGTFAPRTRIVSTAE